MLQYFEHYQPAQLAILVKIEEDLNSRTSHTDPGFRDRAARLLLRFGNDLGKPNNATYLENSAHDASVTPEPFTEYEVLEHIQVEDWIGTISADIERLFPTPDQDPVPYIYASDMIPLALHDSFPNLDVSQRLGRYGSTLPKSEDENMDYNLDDEEEEE
ncbi:uncharacterized protein BO72DRAFT_489066 [Aspergillus fijiensis CBS 313.89]|uniref:Uncharacterized protein n=1 Tax=Aspergillus fijiensis CBS 313.89 TaxID=1448319 RepID=A0A8G1RJ20_9EURO|nr:uncharacterized protein BO72DRAFT_489066 [Aspergillus fijiensis CBS 313.89]RAK73317.1 hypothetical protein BO72DRAFT_489066 [Aspergillus fijiensis CBS 313.89]